MRRREFLGRLATGGAGLVVLPHWARGAAPSDTIRMGIIGVGGMGGGHVRWFLGQPDVRVVAICDVDARRRAEKLKWVHDRYRNQEAKGYGDFRRVLDRPDIDAISTATPDHWHALVTCTAFQAGKDAYSEKPLAHNHREARAMLTMCRRYGRIFQLGTQIHAGDNYHRVVELVRSGALGKIHTVHVWKSMGCPVIREGGPVKPPPGFDYEMWLGPAPWRPYHPGHVFFNFRFFLDYSTGFYADFWCHISDIAFWALDLGSPKTIATRGEFQTQGAADAPKWLDMDLEFPDGLRYFWRSRRPREAPGKVGGGIGCWFQGTEGSLVCDYGSREIFIGSERLRDLADVPKTVPRSPGHQRNFLDSVKSRRPTESNLPYVFRMTAPMFFGRISLLLGRPLRWDAAKEEFTSDEEATRLLGRVHREPWTMPV